MVGCADELARKTEAEKQFSYLIKSNALRDGSAKKKEELKNVTASLEEKSKSQHNTAYNCYMHRKNKVEVEELKE